MAAESDEDDGSDLSDRALPHGNLKIYAAPPNGSHKIIWAWACGTTGILVAIVGSVALYFAGQQAHTNERVAQAITDLAVQVSALKATVESMERRQ